MPRAKNAMPLIRRTVAMNHLQWAEFDKRGGAPWLRRTIDKMRQGMADKIKRNQAIRADLAAGMKQRDVSAKYRVSRATIWRMKK